MKTKTAFISALTLSMLAALPAAAQSIYAGSGVADGGGPADGAAFSSVVVNNSASTINFTINSTQPMASYIFYSIEIQQVGQGANGYAGFANPWDPAVGISTGENALINTYGSGATPIMYSGGNWVSGSSVNYDAGGTGSTLASITVPLSSLGLSAGNSFYFDVVSSYTNPGGQAAYGALDNTGYIPESDNNYAPWNGTSYYDSATSPNSFFGTAASEYTVQAVPEPSTLALIGLGALGMLRRSLR